MAAKFEISKDHAAMEELSINNAGQLDQGLIFKLAQQEYMYSLLGLLVGAAAFGGGLAMVVFTHSTGSVDLLIQYGSTQIHIVTVVIGVVIALFGVTIIWMTRPNIRLGSNDYGGIALRDATRARSKSPGGRARGWRAVLQRWKFHDTRRRNTVAIPPNPDLAAALRNFRVPPGMNICQGLRDLLLNVAENGGPGASDPEYLDQLISRIGLGQLEIVDELGKLMANK